MAGHMLSTRLGVQRGHQSRQIPMFQNFDGLMVRKTLSGNVCWNLGRTHPPYPPPVGAVKHPLGQRGWFLVGSRKAQLRISPAPLPAIAKILSSDWGGRQRASLWL